MMSIQNEELKTNYKKDCLLQNLKIVLWGVLALLFAVLTVLELFSYGTTDITVSDTVKVSSSLINVNEEHYVSSISGSISNAGKDTIRIDAVTVTVSDGKESRDVKIEGFLLPAYYERELVADWEGDVCYDRVTRVAITVDGVEDVLPNAVNTLPVSGIAILYVVLLAVAVLLLIRACKVRYYIYQEMQMQA